MAKTTDLVVKARAGSRRSRRGRSRSYRRRCLLAAPAPPRVGGRSPPCRYPVSMARVGLAPGPSLGANRVETSAEGEGNSSPFAQGLFGGGLTKGGGGTSPYHLTQNV